MYHLLCLPHQENQPPFGENIFKYLCVGSYGTTLFHSRVKVLTELKYLWHKMYCLFFFSNENVLFFFFQK